MAVYNGGGVIRATIDSILNQTFRDFEFIIVDDCSNDDTVKIIESYRESRIVLIRNSSNAGQTRSLNTGLRAAKGEFIARTDAGDISFPQRLEKQVAFLDQNPDIAVLGTSAIRYDEEGRVIGEVHMPATEKAIRQRLLVTTPVVHISVMMRKDVLNRIGGYDDNYYIVADYELWSRLAIAGCKLGNLTDVLCGYMVTPGSFGSVNARGKSFDEACLITQNLMHKLSGLEISPEQAKNIRKMFDFGVGDLKYEEIIESERIYSSALLNANIPKSDIAFELFRKHLKIIFKEKITCHSLMFVFSKLWFLFRREYILKLTSILLPGGKPQQKYVSSLFQKCFK